MKTNAIIVDLDGTLVNNNVRAQNHIQRRRENLTDAEIRWNEFFEKTIEFDQPNLRCIELVNAFNKLGYKILFLTGRMATETTEAATKKWLTMYVNPSIDYELIMRPNEDYRKNEQVKLDLLLNKIMPMYNILFAIDDMRANIDMLRNLGIPALHCADL